MATQDQRKFQETVDWVGMVIGIIIIIIVMLLTVYPTKSNSLQSVDSLGISQIAKELNISVRVIPPKGLNWSRWFKTSAVEDIQPVEVQQKAPLSQSIQKPTEQAKTKDKVEPMVHQDDHQLGSKLQGIAIVRKTKMSPGREYNEHFFYEGDTRVARYRSKGHEVIERSGAIIEGKVKFINNDDQTYGEEFYKEGKREGKALTFFKDGRLKEVSHYNEGKLLITKQYYKDGSLRMEINYEDARPYDNDKEVGIGKVYFKNGVLKYEWNMTNGLKRGFKKAYNEQGRVVSATFFDEFGIIVDQKNY